MKKYFYLFLLAVAYLLFGLVNGCKKNSSGNLPSDIGIKTSFTEEFENVNGLHGKGWVIKDNSNVGGALWIQGLNELPFKSYGWIGFQAYSFSVANTEFAYSIAGSSTMVFLNISSWLITPVLSVKNGDKISFYTRGDTTGVYKNRMQVLMNKSSSSDVGNGHGTVGGFSTLLFDINPAEAAGGYPTNWTKYEYTFSGISGKTDTRIAFRHFLNAANDLRGIGIDLFRFEVN
jgi:hypothetical protein